MIKKNNLIEKILHRNANLNSNVVICTKWKILKKKFK